MDITQTDDLTSTHISTCMFCGSHMRITRQTRQRNIYTCPACGCTYDHEWSLPVFEPGTDTLTTNGEYLVHLFSTLTNITEEEAYTKLIAARNKPDLA